MAAREGQADMTKLPPARPKSETAGARSQSLYVPGGLDEHISRSNAQDSESLLPPPGGGGGPIYTSYSLNSTDLPPAGVAAQELAGSRRTSVNPGGGHMESSLAQMSRGDSHMRAPDRGSTPMRQSARAGSKPPAQDYNNFSSAIMNDRFGHYNRPPSRPPSRDRSVDRFTSRGQTPVPSELINPRSRAPSAQRSTAQDWTPDSGVYEDEVVMQPSGGSRRSSRPGSIISAEAPSLTGNGSVGGGFTVPYSIPGSQQEAESLLRKRACGQEIPACPPTPGQGTVKRTESLYINPIVRRQAQVKVIIIRPDNSWPSLLLCYCLSCRIQYINM